MLTFTTKAASWWWLLLLLLLLPLYYLLWSGGEALLQRRLHKKSDRLTEEGKSDERSTLWNSYYELAELRLGVGMIFLLIGMPVILYMVGPGVTHIVNNAANHTQVEEAYGGTLARGADLNESFTFTLNTTGQHLQHCHISRQDLPGGPTPGRVGGYLLCDQGEPPHHR